MFFLHYKILIFYFSIGNIQAWNDAIWPTSSLATFALIANLGLIFFMFFLGIELDLNQIIKSWKITLPVAATSCIVPGKSVAELDFTK